MESGNLDIKKLIFKALNYWYIFGFFLILSMGAAYLYLKYTPPKYKASAVIMIKGDEESGQPIEEAVFKELGLGVKNKNLEDETLVLTSSPIMKEVVQNLKLNYWYICEEGWNKRHLYYDTPIKVLNWEPLESIFDISVVIHIESMVSFLLETEEMEFFDESGNLVKIPAGMEFRGEFGKDLLLPFGKLMLTRSKDASFTCPIRIKLFDPGSMAAFYIDKLSVGPWGLESSALSLIIEDFSGYRAEDILSELISVYNRKSIEDKNHVYQNTIGLINERLELISQELSAAEKNVENYKQRFNMIELSAEGTQLLGELSVYDREISSVDVQIEILKTIESFLIEKQETFEFVPTNLSLNNLTLTNQLSSFNELLAERSKQQNELGPSHPDLLLTEKQIQNLRGTIIANIRSIRQDLEITKNASVNLKSNLESRMRSLPQLERELVEMERDRSITENLYLYLMQKREESAISLAVTTATGKIVEPPSNWGSPVSPARKIIWLSAFFMGLALPAGIVLLIELLNDKVQLEDDIEKVTAVPVAGMISQSRKKDNIVINKNSRSAVAEMFRLLRANLAYVSPGKELQSILITSSMSGEGKTFIALNLGITLALAEKKVIILELDLRKPKQELYLKAESSDIGIVNYLVDPKIGLQKIIRSSNMHPNLDFINSGPKPPNPSELILSDSLRDLMEELKEIYDVIIIDAPPVGLVADALQMKDLAEATMYVVRYGYTRKGQLFIIEDIAQKDKLPKPFIILNGVQFKKGSDYGYNYGYGYGYGYGNDYYEDEDEKKWWQFYKKGKAKTVGIKSKENGSPNKASKNGLNHRSNKTKREIKKSTKGKL